MNNTIKISMWFAAAFYILSQTLLFKDIKDLLSLFAIGLFMIAPTTIFLRNGKARQYIFSLGFLILAGSAFVSTLILTDFDEAWVDLLKIFVLLYATIIFVDRRGGVALEAYADAAFLSTAIIITLAHIGFIPSESYSAYDSWTKNLGGFSNPNNAPYFIYVSSFLYFILGRDKKVILTTVISVLLFYFEIFSRTYLFSVCFLALSAFIFSYSKILYRAILVPITLVGLGSVCVGVIFYAGVIFSPSKFSVYQGTLLDVLTSLRISVALDEGFYKSNSLLGYSIKRLDSLYTELIFFSGPLCSLIFFSRILNIKNSQKTHIVNFRLYFCYSLLLIIGLLEGQLFNLTPIGVFIFAFIVMGNEKIIKVLETMEQAPTHRPQKCKLTPSSN